MGSVVQGCEFCFGGRDDDVFDDMGDAKDRDIQAWDGVIFPEDNMGSSTAVCTCFSEESGIRVRSKDHSTWAVLNPIIGI